MCYLCRKNSKITYSILLLTLIFLCGLSRNASAQTLNLDTTFFGGVSDAPPRVYSSTTLSSGRTLVAGSYTLVNGVQKPFLVLLNVDGTIDNIFNSGGSGPGGAVYEIVELNTGKILITGSFTSYNGISKAGIARLNVDGTLDTTFNQNGSGTSGTVQGISIQSDGKILLSGTNINSYNGVARFSVMRLNVDGTLDETFNSPFAASYFVEEIDAQPDGKILIAGGFSLGSPARTNLARLNSNGSIDTTFNPGGGGTDTEIYAMTLLPDGKILIGGSFSRYNGVIRYSLARVNSDGSIDTTFDIGNFSGASFESFSVQPDGKVFVAGKVQIGSPDQIYPVIRFNVNGTVDSSFQPAIANNSGYNVKLQPDGKVLVTGFFTTVGGQNHRGIVRYNSNGSVDSSFNPSFNNYGLVDAVAQQPDGKLIVAGTFQNANGTARTNIARFNSNGSLDTSFQPGQGTGTDIVSQNNLVQDIAVQPDGKILIGGIFSYFNGIFKPSIVRLNSDGTLDGTFNASFFYTNQPAYTYDIFVQPDGKILIGGLYLKEDAPSFSGLFRLNSDGSLDTTFNNGAITTNSYVMKITQQTDGKFIIAGNFTTYGSSGTSRVRIARINADGTLDTTFNPSLGANGTIWDAVVQADGRIVIGGSFTNYNGTSRNRLARLNSGGLLDTTFNTLGGANGTVLSILPQPGGNFLIGGSFSFYNEGNSNRLARVTSQGNFDNTFSSGFENQPFAVVRSLLQQTDGKVVVGGVFTSYNGFARNSLLRLTDANPRPAKFDFDGDGKSDISVFRPSNAGWYLNRSSLGFTSLQWGISSDKLVPVDFDGDNRTDVAVFRPENGTWYWIRSSDNTVGVFTFGLSEDIPSPGDYDGDGKADFAVFRPSNGVWYVQGSIQGFYAVQFGVSGDKPVAADFDGDGRTDIAVYRNGVWYQMRSNQGVVIFQFGQANDKPVVGDYDGDGKSDAAVYRDGTWYILGSAQGYFGFQYGIASDVPAPADYDGDGKTDAAVFRDGVWYQLLTQAGSQTFQFGTTNDKPVPAAFIP